MPIWLVTFLTGLITPIVQNIISSLGYDLKIKRLEADQLKLQSGIIKMASAQTDKERDDALNDLSSSWN